MKPEELIDRIPPGEFVFSASRSSGPGGQNVNKVNTKVEVRFDVRNSVALSDDEKERIFSRLKKRINAGGELITTSQSGRTQLANRNKAIEKMVGMLCDALTEKPERKPTSRTAGSQLERLEEKKKRGHIKQMRKGPDKGSAD